MHVSIQVRTSNPGPVDTIFHISISSLFQYPPESARFLVSVGKNEEATKILENAARDNGKELPEGTLEKTKIIQVYYLLTSGCW